MRLFDDSSTVALAGMLIAPEAFTVVLPLDRFFSSCFRLRLASSFRLFAVY